MTATYAARRVKRSARYVISATLAPVSVLGNYDITSNTASFDIAKKAASVTPNAAGKTYGAADPVLTGTLAGFLSADNVTATYSRTPGETVGMYVISATLAPVGVLGNYNITSNTANFTVAKAVLTVTAGGQDETAQRGESAADRQLQRLRQQRHPRERGDRHAKSRDDGRHEQSGGHVSDHRQHGNVDGDSTTRSSSPMAR